MTPPGDVAVTTVASSRQGRVHPASSFRTKLGGAKSVAVSVRLAVWHPSRRADERLWTERPTKERVRGEPRIEQTYKYVESHYPRTFVHRFSF
jgi:hypothetical protein